MSSHTSTFESLELRRLLSTGTIDPAFNSGELLHTTFKSGSSMITDVAVLPDGGILAAGTIRVRHGSIATNATQMALARYNFDGSLDTTFGDGGEIAATPRGMVCAFKLQLTPDGGFIVMGSNFSTGSIDQAAGGEMLVKFTGVGKVDTTFGNNGALKPDHLSTFAVDPQGRILIGGFSEPQDQPHATDATLTRYTAAGKLDTSFNQTGQFISLAPPVVGANNFCVQNFNSIAIDGQGRILASVLREAYTPDQNSLIIYRLTDKGKIDRSYANNGSTVLPSQYYAEEYIAREIARVLGDGSIILSGQTIARVNPSGQFDANYGTDGIADTTSHALPPQDGPYSRQIYNQFAVGADGSVVFVPYTPGLQLSRINPQGHNDTTFGNAGAIALEPSADPTDGFLNAVAIAPDGSIVAAGEDGTESPSGKVDTRAFVTGRVLASEGPAVQLIPRTLQSPSRYLSMTVLIRDPDGVDTSTLDDHDLKLFDADGNTRKIRFLSETDVNGDGKYIQATYRIIGPNSSPWSSSANGTYEVRLQRKQIADTKGNFSMAQVLGTMHVKIA